MRRLLQRASAGALALPLALLVGCATPAPTDPLKPLVLPLQWDEVTSKQPEEAARRSGLTDAWWQALGDPSLDELMRQARYASAEQALARVDEARALLGQQQAGSQPQVSAGINAQRGLEQNGVAQLVSRAGPSLQLSWEADIWGRQSKQRRAAEQRSLQREAESELAILLAQGQLVELTLQERACRRQFALLGAEESSWSRTLRLQREREATGATSAQLRSRQESLAAAQSAQRAQLQGQCRSLRQALRALTGLMPNALDEALAKESLLWRMPPALKRDQPAVLLLQHPQLRAAGAAADAAYQDLGATHATNLPSLSLNTLLSHQWLRVMGQASELNPWSLGISLATPLFDGGAGTAREDAARARFRGAVAALDQALRQTVREIESAAALQEASLLQWQAAKRRADCWRRLKFDPPMRALPTEI